MGAGYTHVENKRQNRGQKEAGNTRDERKEGKSRRVDNVMHYDPKTRKAVNSPKLKVEN